jgi:quercetin dioxygenase-like cupin family protein
VTGVRDSGRPDWTPDAREGFVGVEARVLIGRDDLTVSMLRLAPSGTVPTHRAAEDVDVGCVEGAGWTVIGDEEHPFTAGQFVRWPAGLPHGLRTGKDAMTVVIVHPLGT